MADASAAPRTALDTAKPCLTRMHVPVAFIGDDRHRFYPLSFWVGGHVRSYTRAGEYEGPGHIHPLDIFNEDAMPNAATQLPLGI